MQTNFSLLGAVLLLGLCGCQQGADNAQTNANTVSNDKQLSGATRSPGKPAAPVSIDYKVLGTPLVGQPLAIEIRVASNAPGQAMRLGYFINDGESLMFADAQPETIDIEVPRDEPVAARQVRVVPQREGRLYLNVTAEVSTPDGMMLKSIAVPIAVGSNALQLEQNGALREAANGEKVISLPAAEN